MSTRRRSAAIAGALLFPAVAFAQAPAVKGTVKSVAGRTGAVVLSHNDLTDWASTLSAYPKTANNLSDLASVSTALSNLGGFPAAGGAITGPANFMSGWIAPPIYYARAYGSCTWSASTDVGACIQLAMNDAASAGGGQVIIPAGVYGLSTALVNNTSGVKLKGMGLGIPRDNTTAGAAHYQSTTRLVWIGAANATMLDEEPATLSSPSMFATDIEGITFDCSNLASICAKLATNWSLLDFAYSEPRALGAYLLAPATTDPGGFRHNVITINGRSTSNTYSPTGIYIDYLTTGDPWDISLNDFRSLYVWTTNGDGIVWGRSDNDWVQDIQVSQHGTGEGLIFASQGYVMPNGMTVQGSPRDINIYGKAETTTEVQGFQSGSVVVPNAGNTGTMAFATISQSMTASGGHQGSTQLTMGSTTGIVVGMVINCTGRYASGISDNNVVVLVSSPIVYLQWPIFNNSSSAIACNFTWGWTSTAATGTYTLTATGPSTYSITAPTGGTSQSGITPSSGVLKFTDVVIPITGTAVTGDSWTITTSAQTGTYINLRGLDNTNAVPPPSVEFGGSASFQFMNDWLPTFVQTGWSLNLTGYPNFGSLYGGGGGAYSVSIGQSARGGGAGSLSLGQQSSASGTQSTAIGAGTSASAKGSFAQGYFTNASANYAEAGGNQSTASGTASVAKGYQASDGGRVGVNCHSTFIFGAVQGSDQSCFQMLSGSLTSAAKDLTADQATASLFNAQNLPSGSHFHYQVSASCKDFNQLASANIWASWDPVYGDLDYGAGMISYVGGYSTATAPTRSQGTPAGGGAMSTSTLTLATNTAHGLKVTITPPTGNTDTLHCVSKVTTLEEIQ